MANLRQKFRLFTCGLHGIFYSSWTTSSACSGDSIIINFDADSASVTEFELATLFAAACLGWLKSVLRNSTTLKTPWT